MGAFSIWHLVVLLIFVVPLWRIATKAGFPGALSLLMFVPGLNLILIWVFAFVPWPVERHGDK